MGMVSKSASLLASVALIGCAGTGMPPAFDQRVEIDSHTLLADIAWERQQFNDAVEHYLAAALLADDPGLAERATTLAYQLELPDTGLRAANRWRELAPGDSRAVQYLGLLELQAGNADRSAEHLAAVIEDAGDPGPALMVVLELLAAQSDTPIATEVMARLVERFPGTAQGHYGLARLALRSGDFDLALENARRGTEIDPQWVDGQLLYARTLLLTGRSDEGLRLAASLAEAHPDLEVQLQYAELLLSAGEAEEAEQRLNRILEEHSALPEAVRALAFLALTENELPAAKERFNQLRSDPRYREEAFYYLGRIAETERQFLQATRSYARVVEGTHAVEAQVRTARILSTELSDREGALRHLSEFGEANPRYRSEMLVAQGQLLLQMERRDEAMQLLEDAVTANPGDETLHAARVQLYAILAQDAMNRRELSEAENLLSEGLERYPDDSSLRYAQALLYEEQGRLRKAVTVLEDLVSEQPDDAALLNALGYLLTDRLDRHDEARGYIQRALAVEPDNPAIIDSMGWVLFKLGEYQAALDYLERAFRLEPDPEIAAHLVDVHWALGSRDEALAILRTNIERHPDSPHLKEVNERLTR